MKDVRRKTGRLLAVCAVAAACLCACAVLGACGPVSDDGPTCVVTMIYNPAGYVYGTVEVPEGGLVPVPDDPVREGYDFTGWYADPGWTEEFDFSAAIYSDTVIYAGWKDAVCQVTIDYNYDGAYVDTFEIDAGSTLLSIATPRRDGYVFTGWYVDRECTVEYDFSAKIYYDTVIYAGWAEA